MCGDDEYAHLISYLALSKSERFVAVSSTPLVELPLTPHTPLAVTPELVFLLLFRHSGHYLLSFLYVV